MNCSKKNNDYYCGNKREIVIITNIKIRNKFKLFENVLANQKLTTQMFHILNGKILIKIINYTQMMMFKNMYYLYKRYYKNIVI